MCVSESKLESLFLGHVAGVMIGHGILLFATFLFPDIKKRKKENDRGAFKSDLGLLVGE